MKKAWWLLLFLIPVAHAATISEWPYFFVNDGKFSAKYVVGEEAPSLDVVSATVISTSLAQFQNVTTEVGTSTLDTEISNITRYDAIVIGSPCENRAAYQLMGNPRPCYKDLAGSAGYIKVYEHGSKIQLLITGYEAEDRHAAAKFLAKANVQNIKLEEYTINSNSGSKPPYFDRNASIVSQASSNASNATNVSVVSNATKIETETLPASEKAEKEIGAYEPITFEDVEEELPKREKGFWASFWSWIKGLFT